MKLYVTIPALVAAGLLSACGSSNSTAAVSQIDGGIAFLETLATARDADKIKEVDVNDLPDNATMNGYLAASNNIEGGTVYVGDATADFNFANSTLSGSASNFNEYELAEACADGFEGCTGEQTRALDGSLNIIGGIDGTGFYYDAIGQLTTEDDELGVLTANVYLGGDGEIGMLDDKLIAVGSGGGNADVFGEEGYIVGDDLNNILVLQE